MKFAILILATLAVAGCKDATRAQLFSLSSKHRVTVYSGGVAARVRRSELIMGRENAGNLPEAKAYADLQDGPDQVPQIWVTGARAALNLIYGFIAGGLVGAIFVDFIWRHRLHP